MKTSSLKIAGLTIALAAFALVALLAIHARNAITNHPVPLTPAMFSGYEFTLISHRDYLDYRFQYGSSVDETFGQKGNGAVGMVEGWRIENTNTLVFTAVADVVPDSVSFTNPVRHSLQFKSFGENIVVTTYGQKFTRSKLPGDTSVAP